MDKQFPWRQIFRLALLSGLSPDQIWQMTAAELHALLRQRQHAPVSPDILSALTAYGSQQADGDKQTLTRNGQA